MITTSIILILLVAADQLTKFLTLIFLKPISTKVLIKGVLSLTYVENYGAAFGMLQNSRWVFITLTIAIISAILAYRIRSGENGKLFNSASFLLISGGMSNLIDRIFRGYVVDMIQFTFIDYPVFNFADCCVVAGAVLMCIYVLRRDSDEDKEI